MVHLETLQQLVSDVRDLAMKHHVHAMMLIQGVKETRGKFDE
jgi:hypothetical protein